MTTLDKLFDKNVVFLMWQYKKLFTPYEQQKAFSDQTEFVDDRAERIRIRDIVELPDGDVLLGYTFADVDGKYKEYAKLSEIKLAWTEDDQDDCDDDSWDEEWSEE